MPRTPYASQLSFLNRHADIIELKSGLGARVAVAGEYQGRVMTSTLSGLNGPGFGWLNEPFIAGDCEGRRFKNYGGEDRFWLGPEGGQFGIFFDRGTPFNLDHWRVPPPLDNGPMQLLKQERGSVVFSKGFEVANYAGTKFRSRLRRTIRILDREQVSGHLGCAIPAELKMVCFQSVNTLTNDGGEDWTRQGGLVSIWTLGMFKAVSRGVVVIPFAYGSEQILGPPATTEYFGPVPADRCRIADDHVLFACDGRYRSKIGVSKVRAKDLLGSYDPAGRTLTVVQYSLPIAAARLPYVNSRWEIQDEPYAGDIVNSYNDGPAAGVARKGTFYELETSGPAAELKMGESTTHVHRTYHFSGGRDELNDLTVKCFGVGLGDLAL